MKMGKNVIYTARIRFSMIVLSWRHKAEICFLICMVCGKGGNKYVSYNLEKLCGISFEKSFNLTRGFKSA